MVDQAGGDLAGLVKEMDGCLGVFMFVCLYGLEEDLLEFVFWFEYADGGELLVEVLEAVVDTVFYLFDYLVVDLDVAYGFERFFRHAGWCEHIDDSVGGDGFHFYEALFDHFFEEYVN